MSIKELDRAELFSQLHRKMTKQQQVADSLGISLRHVRRLYRGYKRFGTRALISKQRGSPSNHQLARGKKELILALIQDQYADFGPTLACEKVVEQHKIQVSVWSIRKLMIDNELWNPKRQKKKRVFQLRERRPREGELIQMDGSPHDWFEGRAPKCSLLLSIDDATGKLKTGYFAPSEAIWPYFNLMRQYLKVMGDHSLFIRISTRYLGLGSVLKRLPIEEYNQLRSFL